MTENQTRALMEKVSGWNLEKNAQIWKKFKFKDFKSALAFVNKVGEVADKEGHHPDMEIFDWNNVKIRLSTHAIHALSENDFILAAKIDKI